MLQALGRLHTLLVHFPIALLVAAALFELLRSRRSGVGEASFLCLALGALGAAAAAFTGWWQAESEARGAAELVLRHRWAGVGTAVAAFLAGLAAWRARRDGDPTRARPVRVGLSLTAVLVVLTAYLGSELVHGEGHLFEPLRRATPALPGARAERAEAPLLVAAPEESALPVAEESGETRALAPVDYASEIGPLFARRCGECHGERKRPKGNLQLTDLAAVLARAPSEAAIVPGDPLASRVYQRLVLPADHEDLMPPEEGPLPREEIELVHRWIREGARWTPPEGLPALADVAADPLGLVLDATQRALRDQSLARLRARGARAQLVSACGDEVEVDLGVALPLCGDAELALLEGLEPCLVELSLARTAVSDAGVAVLARFPRLTRLRLEHTALGDAALEALAPLPALESLSLYATRLTDEGLSALARMPQLERLYAGATGLSPAASAELARLRPGLRVLGP